MASLSDLRKNPVIDLAITVVVAVGIAYLVQAFIVKPYRVPSGSMEPTIAIGERIIASRITLRFSDPSRDDIVVFHGLTRENLAQIVEIQLGRLRKRLAERNVGGAGLSDRRFSEEC